jgi:hypothetical protein
MEISTIRIALRDIPGRFSAMSNGVLCDEMELFLDASGLQARVTADSFTLYINVSTNFLVDAVTALKDQEVLS